MRPKAIDVKPLEDYMLLVIFENGEKKIFDVKPYLTHKAFEQLNDKALFNTVKLSGLSISWLNGAGICPDELYNNSKSISE
mgnify:FL=1